MRISDWSSDVCSSDLAVSIALVEEGQPIIGVLDAPARDEHWSAVRGGGARRNGEVVSVTPRDVFPGSRVPADQLPKIDSDLVAVHKPHGIALRMAMVAAGEEIGRAACRGRVCRYVVNLGVGVQFKKKKATQVQEITLMTET